MIIFHEDNDIIESLNCASNVKKINVKMGGLAQLIAKAVSRPVKETDPNIDSKEKQLSALLSKVLQNIPFFLAQFKIGVCNQIYAYNVICDKIISLEQFLRSILRNIRIGLIQIRKQLCSYRQ
jgi:hypothetical protein